MVIDLKHDIESTVQEECFRGGFDILPDIQEFHGKPHFEMHTSLETRETAIKYNPEYEQKNPGKTQLVIRDGTRHEIDHHKYRGFYGCPRDLDSHSDLIYNPLAEVLIPKTYSPEDVHYLSNALEDTILHSDLSSKFSLGGIAHFFEDVGKTSKFTPFYQAHVMLNLYLWANKQKKKQLKKYFQTNPQVKEVLQNFLEKTGISKLKQEINVYETRKTDSEGKLIERTDKKISVKDKSKIRDYLNDEKNWPLISKVYAEEFSKLMQPGYALPLFNHSGAGTKGKESENPNEKNEQGNEFDKQMKSKGFRKSRIKRAYSKGEEKPIWMDSFESLDLLYESLAQPLVVKAQSFSRQSSMPIAWYGNREFKPDKDDFRHIDFRFNDNGKLELRKKRYHIDYPVDIKLSQRGFPSSRFGLLDASGSMASDFSGGSDVGNTLIFPWGDKSKYHGALIEWYSLLEYLRENHLLTQTGIELGVFSNRTQIGKGLLEAKRVALNPQFGSTTLDFEKIKNMFEGRGNLVFTISDGDIQNWEEIKDKVIEGAKKHFYFHLQIGETGETNASEDLKNAGLYVDYLRTAEDLRGRTIDLTDKLLRRAATS